jgi:hypothetical protein
MSSSEATNLLHVDDDHAWLLHIDITASQPCCGGPIIKPSTPFWTHDLSEANEDRCVQASEVAVRQVFQFARMQKQMRNILKGADELHRGPDFNFGPDEGPNKNGK